MKKYQKNNDYSYTLGITVTIELLNIRPDLVKNIYVHSKYIKNEVWIEIENMCLEYNIPIITNDKIFNTLSDKENCFIIAEFKKYDCYLKDGMHIVLVNPSNQGNMGTIMRSALGFGIKNIAIITPAVDVFDPKVIRSSMGAIFDINFEYFDSFDEYLKKYPGKNMFPFMLKANKKVNDVTFDDSSSLVFGPESSGLDDMYLKIGTPIIIPITNNIDSLNLPIAVSIACYEATKEKFTFDE